MRVKKFQAASVAEAMERIKQELGPEAIIVDTRRVPGRGFWGWLFGSGRVEVTAVAETPRAEPARAPSRLATAPAAPLAAEREAAQLPPTLPAVAAPPAGGGPAVEELRQEMGNVVSMLDRVVRRLETPDSVARLEAEGQRVYQALVAAGVDADLAGAVLGRVKNRVKKGQGSWTQANALTREVLEQDLGRVATIAAAKGQRRVVSLVGPTGVGKTTTLAKMAAHYALGRGMKVSMITADTYRIAAVDQLRMYAEIIGVPLEVVYSPEELVGALGRMADRDLVLVDNAGRSHKNRGQMDELAGYLRALRADETYLVLALTHGSQDALGVVEAYSALGFDRLVFTKLDEAACPGTMYNVVARTRKPLSYLTAGQTVPDDIEVANPAKLSQLLLGG